MAANAHQQTIVKHLQQTFYILLSSTTFSVANGQECAGLGGGDFRNHGARHDDDYLDHRVRDDGEQRDFYYGGHCVRCLSLANNECKVSISLSMTWLIRSALVNEF